MTEVVSVVSSEYASAYAEKIMLTLSEAYTVEEQTRRLAQAQIWATLAVAAATREHTNWYVRSLI